MPHHTCRCPKRICLIQGAPLAAQASLTALPGELLVGILRRAWADRPLHFAAEEVRAAAGLASVCRRMRALLRVPPLPLALDFSAKPVSDAQRRWLLDPAQAGRLEAASSHSINPIWARTPCGSSYCSMASWRCMVARCCGSPACRCIWWPARATRSSLPWT